MTRETPQEEKSRSQLKREYLELKALGVQLVALSKGQLRAIPLSDATREAVRAASEMKRAALQRQYRYLASLISEEEDIAAIRAALAGEARPHEDEVQALHAAEHWRDRLLSEDADHQAAFAERYPACDRKRLSQLVRNARKERSLEKPPRSARLLFRFVKELVGSAGG